MKNLGIAVIGVGHMGRFHCQKVATLRDAGEGVELVGVVDLDRERGEVRRVLEHHRHRDSLVERRPGPLQNAAQVREDLPGLYGDVAFRQVALRVGR